MELIPGTGIGKLMFGMKAKQVEELLGTPDLKFNDEDKNDILVYNGPRLRLTFYEDEDFRLGYLICANPDLTIDGSKIIGQPLEHAKQAFAGKSFRSWETERFDMAENHFNESNWLILQQEFGVVAKVEIGAIINERDEIDWKYPG